MAHQIVLTWDAPLTGPTVVSYDVQRAPAPNGVVGVYVSIASPEPTVTTYTDTTVVAGQEYSYQVLAVDSLGESSPSVPNLLILTPSLAGMSVSRFIATMVASAFGNMRGTSRSIAVVTPTVGAVGRLAGTSHSVATAHARMGGVGRISSASHGVFIASATIHGRTGQAGVSHSAAVGHATLTGVGRLAASAGGSTSVSTAILTSGLFATIVGYSRSIATGSATAKAAGNLAGRSVSITTAVLNVGSAIRRIIGGEFQSALGDPLSYGYLFIRLNTDAMTVSHDQVCAGRVVRVPLDVNGNIILGSLSLWPNSQMTPPTVYIITAYTAQGQLVWRGETLIPFGPGPYDLAGSNFLIQEDSFLFLFEADAGTDDSAILLEQ